MMDTETRVRKWGHSLGVVIPKANAELGKLRVGEKLHVFFRKRSSAVEETFGIFRGMRKKSGQQMKDEIRRELHGI